MKKLPILVLLTCSVFGVACSSGNKAPDKTTVQTAKLERAQAEVTLARWSWGETQKAYDYLKMGKYYDPNSSTVDTSDVMVGTLKENSNTVEADVFWRQGFMILEGKTGTNYPGGTGTATFEQKGGKWFLKKVSGPHNFMRDDLMFEVDPRFTAGVPDKN